MRNIYLSVSIVTGIGVGAIFLLRKKYRLNRNKILTESNFFRKCLSPWMKDWMTPFESETFREINSTIGRQMFYSYLKSLKLWKISSYKNSKNQTETIKKESFRDSNLSTNAGGKSIFGFVKALTTVPEVSRNSTVKWENRTYIEVKKTIGKPKVSDKSPSNSSWTTIQNLGSSREDFEENREVKNGRVHPTLQKFKFVRIIAEGSFGKVALAKNPNTNEYVAIKSIKKLKRLLGCIKREKMVFDVINSFLHPFLVEMRASFQIKTHVFFVMEYIPGGDLYKHVRKTSPSNLQHRATFYSACVVLAVAFLHSHHIVHRDLKLQNILICEDGYIKVADYGLSRKLQFGYYAHSVCGTLTHMAPEILNKEPYTEAVDWWAVGIILYEMLTKKCPFRGREKETVLDLIYGDAIDFPPYLTVDAVDIVRGFLKRNPVERLGNRTAGVKDIKEHPFYRKIDWESILEKRMPPPFVPVLKERDRKESEMTEWPSFTDDQNTTVADINLDNFSYMADCLPSSVLCKAK